MKLFVAKLLYAAGAALLYTMYLPGQVPLYPVNTCTACSTTRAIDSL